MTHQSHSFEYDHDKPGIDVAREWVRAGRVGGFLNRLNVTAEACSDGEFSISCAIDGEHSNMVGLVHGGLLSAMVDIAGGGAVLTRLKAGEYLLTSDLNIRFLAPVPIGSAQVHATGRVTHTVGRRMIAGVDVTADDGTIVAEGSVGISVRSHKR